ncbi:SDR family oxidoreductase [Verrucomicrobia bacterium]|nr:SDR family oxidoreductase [Verrucomicrobiota bacterium]MDA7657494.1 SDR family oxidoreductase [Verrucomicrobiota bacterium]
MKENINSKIQVGRVARITADALMLGGSLLLAFLVRYFIIFGFEGTSNPPEYYARLYEEKFLRTVWLLGILGFILFSAFGFYNKSRSYKSRYKVLIILQAVGIIYLLFSLSGFLIPNVFYVPRGVLVLGWFFSSIILVMSRLWSSIWKLMIKEELQEEFVSSGGPCDGQVLVIGGGGYIGSALLPKLLEAGFKVRLLDAFVFGEDPIREIIGHENLEIVKGDFRQIEKVVESMLGIESVVHLGGIVGDPACAHDEELTLEINLMATKLIVEVAKAHRVKRFIFASTCSVYGANDVLLDEKSCLNPVSLYASSKIASEKVLEEIATSTFRPVILRFGTIYGFSGRIRFDLVVNLLTAKAVREGKITLFGGDQWRPFVHVDDAAKGVLLCLLAPGSAVDGEIFNIGSDEQNHTLEQVGKLIQELVPSAELVEMGSDSDRRNYKVSFAKIRETLGFVPSWSLKMGIQQVKDALNNKLVGDYKENRYSNIRTITDEKSSQLLRFSGWEKRLIEETKARD